MTTKRRTILLRAVAAAAWAGLGGSALGQAKTGTRKIVLGQSVPLTGAASEIGLAFAAGAKLYVDSFNGRKNSPGWNFELRQVDDGYDPAKAAANARKLLADGADLLFGFVGTASSDAGAAVARQQGAIFFAPFAASDTLREPPTPTYSMCAPASPMRLSRWCATVRRWGRRAWP